MFMSFSLVRLRALLVPLLLFSSFSFAKEDSLFTSSVTYCEPPETLLVQQFDIAYFAKNQSVSFNVSVASVQANVNVSANLLLNVYGIHAINITLDLCSIFNGALCPLPMYNFTGSDSLSLPQSLGVQDKIPGIAFKIPDLEGVAQLILTEVSTGNVKACVQATLSNGWSMHQPSVEWLTGGIALATLFVALWQSMSLEALLPFRLIDLLFLYQTIASTSFLSLNYPSAYRAFTLNFAWAMGLFATSPTSSLQPSIDRMRHLTGGTLANSTSTSAVGLVNRKLSPYNFITYIPYFSLLMRRATDFSTSWAKYLFSKVSTSHPTTVNLASATQGQVQTVTTTSSNILQAGIPIYVNSLHIATANAFMTTFLCTLMFIASALGAFLLALVFVVALGQIQQQGIAGKQRFKSVYLAFVQAWGIRLALSLFLPIIVFTFYQWTLHDSWLSILLSVIAFIALLIVVLYPTVVVLRYARREGRDALYKDREPLASKGPLFGQYRAARFYFFVLLLSAAFLKAVFIAFGQASGQAQIILMVVLEGFTVIAYLVFRPCRTRGGNVFSTFLAIIRLVCNGLMIAFAENLNVSPIPRTVIGLVIAVIFSVTIVATYVNILLDSGIDRLWKRGGLEMSSHSSAESSIMEKGDRNLISSSSSSGDVARPPNPTPHSSNQIDPQLLQPFPVSPTETEVTTSVYTSNRTSGTTTLGSTLPRRWSFTPLNSPTSPATSSQTHEPSSSSQNGSSSRS